MVHCAVLRRTRVLTGRNQCGEGECCQGCGVTGSSEINSGDSISALAGHHVVELVMVMVDGVHGCGWCQDGPKCKDNNTYPCYWAPWKDESTRDVKKLWGKANNAIAELQYK